MGWLAFNFECETPGGRDALVEWFADTHEVEPKEPQSSLAPGVDKTGGASAGHRSGGGVGSGEDTEDVDPLAENLLVADVTLSRDDGDLEGEMVGLDSYLYLTVHEDPGPLLEETAAYWNRAVRAQLETMAGGCPRAVLYSTVGSHAVEIARYEGQPSNAAIDVMYILVMAHQFRFRAYGDILPDICQIPFPSAYNTPAEVDPGSDMYQEMAEKTGVEPTREGIRFFQRDPMRAEENRPTLGPGERVRGFVRSRIVRPLRTAIVALRAGS